MHGNLRVRKNPTRFTMSALTPCDDVGSAAGATEMTGKKTQNDVNFNLINTNLELIKVNGLLMFFIYS